MGVTPGEAAPLLVHVSKWSRWCCQERAVPEKSISPKGLVLKTASAPNLPPCSGQKAVISTHQVQWGWLQLQLQKTNFNRASSKTEAISKEK